MTRKNKITLIGSYGNGKTLTSFALSKIMNIPRAHVENIDSLYKDIYGVEKDPKLYTTPELFSVGLARFHSRIRQEKKDGFISDGSVLNELAYGYARIKISSKSSKSKSLKKYLFKDMYEDFGKRLERTIVDYAKTAYDAIYYLKIDPISQNLSETTVLFQNYFDEKMTSLLEKNNIKYNRLSGNVESFNIEILNEHDKYQLSEINIKELLIYAQNEKKLLKEDFHFGKK